MRGPLVAALVAVPLAAGCVLAGRPPVYDGPSCSEPKPVPPAATVRLDGEAFRSGRLDPNNVTFTLSDGTGFAVERYRFPAEGCITLELPGGGEYGFSAEADGAEGCQGEDAVTWWVRDHGYRVVYLAPGDACA